MSKKPTLIPVGCTNQNDQDARKFYNDLEVDILARTLWGEARNQGNEGMEAVANVVLNRVRYAQEKNGFWWGDDIIQVCQKAYQFSCWNSSDPNSRKARAVDTRDLYFVTALRIARRAVIDALSDNTNGATHYHTTAIKPYWAKGVTPCARIGDHVFYRMV